MKKYGIILICICLLAGCGSTNAQKNQSKEGSGSTQAEASVLLKEQTIWQVLDEKGNQTAYLPETDTDAAAVKVAVEQHSGYVDARTHKDQHLKQEEELYTEDFKESLDESGYEKAVADMYVENQMEVSPEGLVWYVSTFDEKKSFCKVTVDARFRIQSCSEEYLSAHSLEKDKSYQEQRVYYLEKTDGDWKISNIEKSALGESAAQEG